MSIRATKNMWVTRCEHIGALVGGFLSLIFGWIPKLYLWVKSTGPILLIPLITLSFVAYMISDMRDTINLHNPADIKSIKKFINSGDVECRKELIGNKIKSSNTSISYRDLKIVDSSCKNRIEVEKQKELLKELNQ